MGVGTWEPTWNDSPITLIPLAWASCSNGNACSGVQPNFLERSTLVSGLGS